MDPLAINPNRKLPMLVEDGHGLLKKGHRCLP
jgi:glutathione S-transferase